MAAKSNSKSKNQTRGGRRPGAGRPSGSGKMSDGERRDYRAIAIEIALGGVETALKSYPVAGDDWTQRDHRRHIAMVLIGVPPQVIAAALFKPDTSEKLWHSINAAIKAVEDDVAAG